MSVNKIHLAQDNLISQLLVLGLLLLMFTTPLGAKGRMDGFTPSALSAGAPTGSYSLSDFEQVNPFNGSVNFTFPLHTVIGRGGAQYTMTLPIDDSWVVENDSIPDCSDPFFGCITTYIYNPYHVGTTNGYRKWFVRLYEAGTMIGRREQIYTLNPNCGACVISGGSLTRLSFIMPDGTEMELRDDNTKGKPFQGTYPGNSVNNNPTTGFPRGTVFITADGTSATFISNTEIVDLVPYGNAQSPPSDIIYPSGRLLLSNGTRYDIDRGSISSIRDKNGNRLSFEYDQTDNGQSKGKLVAVQDSLGRRVTVNYNVQANAGEPYGLHDKITFNGFGRTTRVIRVSKSPLRESMRADYSVRQFKLLFPELNLRNNSFVFNVDYNADYNPQVYSSVWLPDDRRYKFLYNDYAELSRIELPTGGAIEYDITGGVRGGAVSGVIGNPNVSLEIYRRLVERRTYQGNGTVPEGKTTYSRPDQVSGSTYTSLDHIDVDHLDPASNNNESLGFERHYYHGNALQSLQTLTDGSNWARTRYPAWREGKQFRRESYAADRVTLLRQTTYTWRQRAPINWWPSNYTSEAAPPNDPRLVETVTALTDVTPNLVSKETAINPQDQNDIRFDQFNNQTDVWVYDYGEGAPGQLLYHSHLEFLTTNQVNSTDYLTSNIHIRRQPTQRQLFDANGVEKARIIYEYDKYADDISHKPLVSYTNIKGLDSAFNSSYETRGNLTATTQYLFDSSGTVTGSIAFYAQYDIAGNIVKVIDARGYPTLFDYSDSYGVPDAEARANSVPEELGAQGSQAFPTKMINTLGQINYAQYDYYSGKPVNTEDANGIISSFDFTDPLDRQKLLIRDVNNLAAKSSTIIDYDDANRVVTTRGDLNVYGDGLLKSETLYDTFGRMIESRGYEPNGDFITAKQEYDSLGRVKRASNPYRDGETIYWTTTGYDSLGRATKLTMPDGAEVNTSYSGTWMLANDPAGQGRISQTNALGQLKEVWELTPADDATEAISFPGHSEVVAGYRTKYDYDTLGNIVTMTQRKGVGETLQTRSFVYDSLSRLTSSTNPESGTNSYQYDNNGNLLQKTDARNIVTIYGYDESNRVTSRTYQNDDGMNPPVYYKYDSQSLPTGAPAFNRGPSTGRLVAALYGSANSTTGSYQGYDALGRVKLSIQRTNDGQSDQTYTFANYDYDLAGHLTSQTYPSGKVVLTEYDSAGRVAGVKKPAGAYYIGASPVNHNEPNRILYTAHGGVQDMRLGNGLWEHTKFNSRLQPTEIRLGTTQGGVDRLKLEYSYGATNNNGNVRSQTISVQAIGTTTGFTGTQTYEYDAINRLLWAKEMNGATQLWKQYYSYDRFGNRRFNQAETTLPAINPNNPAPTNPAINEANNQLSGTGYSYDAAGNLKCDPAHPCSSTTNYYEYNAENQLVKSSGGANPNDQLSATYFYDHSGKRVKKITGGANPVTTIFVYDASGRLSAEYSNHVSGGSGTNYLTGDMLGTPRIITGANINDSSGGVKSRHDYLPFGEEVFVGRNGVYPGADVRQQFTRKERDVETGLDNFGARYYSSTQGRFTSADSFAGTLANPQSLNRYTYVWNNPLNLIDENGRWPTDIHNRIIDLAFPGLAEGERGQLKSASFLVDLLGQGVNDSYLHAMRSNSETIDEAANKMDSYIRFNSNLAALYQKGRAEGFDPMALYAFGRALHPITDNTSPMHEGFQAWGGWPLLEGFISVGPDSPLERGLTSMITHSQGETWAAFTPERRTYAVKAAQAAFHSTFGEALYQKATTSPAPGNFYGLGISRNPVWQAYQASQSGLRSLAVITVHADGSTTSQSKYGYQGPRKINRPD